MIRFPTLLLAIVLLFPLSLTAHQSGCHAVHSCPSDSGDYICGDKSYCSECPDNSYCQAAESRFERFGGTVVGVTDGDTVNVAKGNIIVKVRLWGIDCPEYRHDSPDNSQPWGRQAYDRTYALAFRQDAHLIVRDMDRYGRSIAEVWLPGGVNLSRILAEEGLCMWYRQYAETDVMLEALEAQAQEDERGLWGDPEPIPPWEWRQGER